MASVALANIGDRCAMKVSRFYVFIWKFSPSSHLHSKWEPLHTLVSSAATLYDCAIGPNQRSLARSDSCFWIVCIELVSHSQSRLQTNCIASYAKNANFLAFCSSPKHFRTLHRCGATSCTVQLVLFVILRDPQSDY